MRLSLRIASALALLGLAAPAAHADIVGLYNTGTDDTNTTVSDVSQNDIHYTVISSPAGAPPGAGPAYTFNPKGSSSFALPDAYSNDDPAGTQNGSKWISEYPPGGSTNASPPPYVYETSFTTTNSDVQTISGRIAADDVIGGSMQIAFVVSQNDGNGNYTVINTTNGQFTPDPGYSQFSDFSFSFTNATPGSFHLDIYDNNTNGGKGGFTPEAINVHFTLAPEPSTIQMGLGAIGLLGLVRWARSRRSRTA